MLIKLALFIVLISVNYLESNCDEETIESIANEDTSEISGKTNLLSTDPIELEGKADNIMSNHEEVSEIDVKDEFEESTSYHYARSTAEFDDFSDIMITEASIVEKSAYDEIIAERNAEDLDKTEIESKSADTLEIKSKQLSEGKENQLEKLMELSKSGTEIEEKTQKDLSEASPESRNSDLEKASTIITESYQINTKSGEIEESSDEVNLDEIIQTRRMLSSPEIFLDTKARSDEGPSVDIPENKFNHNPNINTRNNFEFDSESNVKIADRALPSSQNNGNTIMPPLSMMDLSALLKTTMPAETIPSHEIFKQQNLPKFYPRSELNINFPIFDSQLSEPRTIPIYLELKQDLEQLNNFGAHDIQKSTDERQSHISQEISDFKRSLDNNQFRNMDHTPRSLERQFNQNQGMGNSKSITEERNNRKSTCNRRSNNRLNAGQGTVNIRRDETMNHEARNQIPLPYQNQAIINRKESMENRQFGNFDHKPRNQIQSLGNPNPRSMALENYQSRNLNYEQRDQVERSHLGQGIIDPNIMSMENKGFESINYNYEKYTNPYTHGQQFQHPETNVLNAPDINYNPPTKIFNTLFKTLADATGHPKKAIKYLQSAETVQTYPQVFYPIKDGSYSYDSSYLPGF